MNDEIFNKIKQMIEDGFARKRISYILKIDMNEIVNLIQENKFEMTKEVFSNSEIPRIKLLYELGVSAKSLGIKYSIGKGRVQKWAKEDGNLRSRNDSHRFTFFNQNAFDEINSKESAYWLGFLYADSYNCCDTWTVSVSLASKDYDHLIKFAKFLNYPTDEVFYGEVDLNGERYPTANIKLYSKHLCEQLKVIGCPQGKSLILKYPNWIDINLQKSFILGYFDGDGSIKMNVKTKEWRANFCGTKHVLDNICSLIKTVNINSSISYHSKTKSDTWVMDISGNEQIMRFYEWLYADQPIWMNRKFERFQKLKTQQSNRKISKIRDNYFINTQK